MADSTMATGEILLFDRSPGPVHWGNLPPASAAGNVFTNNSHANNSATQSYEPGYKVGYFDKTNQGPSILAYMKYAAGTTSTLACAAGHICSQEYSVGVSSAWYTITNDGDDGMLSPQAYIALEIMTDTYWGWFWCGGVAPADHISVFTATDTLILTDSNVIDESLLEMADGTADVIVFKPVATTYQACGIAFAQDD